MGLNQAFKLVYLISIKYLVLKPVSLLLLLVYLALASPISLIKWLLVTTTTMGGKLRMRRQKISQRISMLIN